MTASLRGLVCLFIALSALAGCGAQSPVDESEQRKGNVLTAAELFEQMKKQMQERRIREPHYMQRYAVDPLEMLDVKVEDWLATPEGRFAHSIKIPNPVPEDSGYRPGMTQQEYFEHLCKNEAGEFLFRTADSVEGVFQMRPRRIYSAGEWKHLYALEDPYGYWIGEWHRVGFTIVGPDLYSYFEIHRSGNRAFTPNLYGLFHPSLYREPPPGKAIARYSGYDGQDSRTMRIDYDIEPKARYGFTWRGIRRPHDREMGIAGGELIVLDLQTNEVMGVRRGYAMWNGEWTGRVCPKYGYIGGQDKATGFTTWFIAKVVRPPRWREYFARIEKGRTNQGDFREKR
jgi:hypothetical protein